MSDFSKKCLNLGCGSRYIESWENLDFVSNTSSVIEHDLSSGIPYSNDSFDVVYHSHVLEHFSKSRAKFFIEECYRVLTENGIIRVVVPDLEQIVRSYLNSLEAVKSKDTPLSRANYEWAVIELLDQMVRNQSGGVMLEYWLKKDMLNELFIAKRLGFEFTNFRKRLNENKPEHRGANVSKIQKLKYYLSVSKYRKHIAKWLLKEPRLFELLELANFRLGGEVHQWMYDSYSLSALLGDVGFREVKVVDAFSSSIPCWDKFNWLDVENGEVRKPDSLFIEAKK